MPKVRSDRVATKISHLILVKSEGVSGAAGLGCRRGNICIAQPKVATDSHPGLASCRIGLVVGECRRGTRFGSIVD
jgi:hypothetical protein